MKKKKMVISNLLQLFKKENADYYESYKTQTAFKYNYVEYMSNGNDDFSIV